MAHVDGQEKADLVVREVRLEGGGIIIYDPENEEAWIQADSPTVLDGTEFGSR